MPTLDKADVRSNSKLQLLILQKTTTATPSSLQTLTVSSCLPHSKYSYSSSSPLRAVPFPLPPPPWACVETSFFPSPPPPSLSRLSLLRTLPTPLLAPLDDESGGCWPTPSSECRAAAFWWRACSFVAVTEPVTLLARESPPFTAATLLPPDACSVPQSLPVVPLFSFVVSTECERKKLRR